MPISVKTYNEFLGDLIRKIKADTAVNDLHEGSVFLTLLEAVAENDFDNAASILSVLQQFNIDAVSDDDLEKRAFEYGLEKIKAMASTGFVTIVDTNITKRSTALYPLKLPPIKGSTEIYVMDASNWSPTGSLFIGRNTKNYEGPITYSAIVNNVSFYTITLSSALQKDHLLSETVIDSQGTTDRFISSGTEVYVEANNQNPRLTYYTSADALMASGEDTIENIPIVAETSGAIYNTGVNTIVNFSASPFSGASVTNPNALVTGRDPESDQELRDRIKNIKNILSRGTADAILNAVIGISDDEDNKQVVSAKLKDSSNINDIAKLYIDDSTGFSPTFDGQSVDKLIDSANGSEEFLQLANYPVTRPQVINTNSAPFVLKNLDTLKVLVDEELDEVQFVSSDFYNIASASLIEVVTVINDKARLYSCRLSSDGQNLIIQPKDWEAEKIQVVLSTIQSEIDVDANQQFGFPTDEKYAIRLYQNEDILNSKDRKATLFTTVFSSWNILDGDDLIMSVDGTSPQTQYIYNINFPGGSIAGASADDWVGVLNLKFAGVTFTAQNDGRLKIESNKIGDSSSLEILGGNCSTQMFEGLSLSDQGQNKDYILNRQTGNIQILKTINIGDSISAGKEDVKGSIISTITSTGEYDFSVDANNRVSAFILVADANEDCKIKNIYLNIGDQIDITPNGYGVTTILSYSLSTFYNVNPGDYIYITNGTTFTDIENCGMFKVISKGIHTIAGVDTTIVIDNINSIAASYTVVSNDDMQAFKCGLNTYPQLWTGNLVSNSANTTISDFIDSINDNMFNVLSEIYKTNRVRITSTLEDQVGSIFMPVVVGNAKAVFVATNTKEQNYPPHVANMQTSSTLFTYFSRMPYSSTYLNRNVFMEMNGAIQNTIFPGVEGVDLYSETIMLVGLLSSTRISAEDIINFTFGNNRGIYKSIKHFLSADRVGTQFSKVKSLITYMSNFDYFDIVKPIQLSDTDVFTVVMDQDDTFKKVDMTMSRTGKVNSGSVGVFAPTDISFSADDYDNEAGINFSTSYVWDKTITGAEFKDYTAWFKARNIYKSQGCAPYLVSSGDFIVRSSIFGPSGERVRFSIDYPTSPNMLPSTYYNVTPNYTSYQYFFGSGAEKSISVIPGAKIGISSLGNNIYRLAFTDPAGLVDPIDLSSVVPGDVITIGNNSGVAYYLNLGTFLIVDVNDAANTLDVRASGCMSITGGAGVPEVTDITTISDIKGSSSVVDFTTIDGSTLDGKYFILEESADLTAVWFDATGGAAPVVPGATKYVRVAIEATDTDATIADKICLAVGSNTEYTGSFTGANVTLTSAAYGLRTLTAVGTSGFVPFAITTAGINSNSLSGKYFILYDSQGPIKFWYETELFSSVIENGPIVDRSFKIQISDNDIDTVVAAKTDPIILSSSAEFSVSTVGAVITVTNSLSGARPDGTAGTTGFTMLVTTPGVTTTEVVTNPLEIKVYPLSGTTTTDLETYVNADGIIEISIVNSSLTTLIATKDETSVVGYGHNVTPALLNNGFISLYDGVGYVETFENTDPNFSLKLPFVISTYDPAIYTLDTCINYGTADLGEFFKLIPTTIENVLHNMNHKALSQLPIISDVTVSNDKRRIQIKSKQLGSDGSVEVKDNTANGVYYYVKEDASIYSQDGVDYLETKIESAPVSLSVGDYVKLYSDSGVPRTNIFAATDDIQVTLKTGTVDTYEYRYKHKLDFTGTQQVSITHSGSISRWTFDSTATPILADVKVGDVLIPSNFNNTSFIAGWHATNTLCETGNDNVAGFVIVDFGYDLGTGFAYVDVINPLGQNMGATQIGVGAHVLIAPCPTKQFRIQHFSKVDVDNILVAAPTVATITTKTPHHLNVGDSFTIDDTSAPIAGSYTVDTITSIYTFTCVLLIPTALATYSFGYIVNTTLPLNYTKYKIEKLNYANLVKLTYLSGEQPKFISNGVAVDDWIKISGNTFSVYNNGLYRICALNETSLVFENPNAIDELNTIHKLNNFGYKVNWMSSSSYVSGVAGTFKYLNTGDWIKKESDSDDLYVNVIGSDTGSYATATVVYLGKPYSGLTDSAASVFINMTTDINTGVILDCVEDIMFYEADSVFAEDTLYIPYYSVSGWFSSGNTGSFSIESISSDSLGTPEYLENMIRVKNDGGVLETASLAYDFNSFVIYEGVDRKYSTVRKIENINLDYVNTDYRKVMLSPADKYNKISTTYRTKMVAMGKLGFPVETTVGTDGYSYYTGLLRKTQRLVDGYSVDPDAFPGQRSVGAVIEVMPPLLRRIVLSMNVTTRLGVNLVDVKDSIKTSITNYINRQLGVGDDVILSELIVVVMDVRGVDAVTILDPDPSVYERIAIDDDEKAYISSGDISIS